MHSMSGRFWFLITNGLTLAGVLCGFKALHTCLGADSGPIPWNEFGLWMLGALFFDVADGRVARWTGSQSAFGVQLDSLADLVSFGVAPAVMLQRWTDPTFAGSAGLVGFLFVAAGAVRLSRFNVLTSAPSGTPKPPDRFIIGLPIPGAAGVLVSLLIAADALKLDRGQASAWMLAVALGLAVLMVSRVGFRSFKQRKLEPTSAGLIGGLLCLGLLLGWYWTPAVGIAAVLLGYVAMGVSEATLRLSSRARLFRRPRWQRETLPGSA